MTISTIKPDELRQLSEILNKQVANFNILYVKLHNYHWYIQGPHFFTLHAKFEEVYTEITAYMDEVAERLLTIGGSPVATMAGFLETSSLQEASGDETDQQMVETIHNDLSAVVGELKEGIEIASKLNDEATADILLAIHTSFEKHIWMFRSFLGN